ncbi:LacI family transcriptional regulator, partial [Mesorhizobium sp. M8A.F.Ca.ET.059.01.1.1]
MALVALEWLSARGLNVPDDVSVVGFDDVPEAAVSKPPLTTIAQPIAEIGRLAVRAILESDGPVSRHQLPVELIVRGSSGPPRA